KLSKYVYLNTNAEIIYRQKREYKVPICLILILNIRTWGGNDAGKIKTASIQREFGITQT
ncbi:hypothetical protein, partial [Providencia rustigianii]|uniref:hypothetical protein n=1 Tax=Providencia rustigianii TaxID=158850 RepID=UPI0022446B99